MNVDTIMCDFPDWALCLLEYGDESGLMDEDIALARKWTDSMAEDGYTMHSVTDDHNEFCPFPEFGPACATTRVVFMKKAK